MTVPAYLLAQLSTDVAKSLATVEAECVQTAVAQHFIHLGILLAWLLEDQLTFLVLVLVLTATTVLTSLT